MLIISRIFWFLYSAILLIIVAVIALMVVRLIVEIMDPNPFGWTSRTVRRLSDGFIFPVRAGLRGATVDPKFAPLVVILIVILLGFFILQLTGTIASTVAGVLQSAQRGAVISILGFILYGLIAFYILLIIIRVTFSWGRISYSNRIMRFLVDTTEPMLGPMRRMIPLLGWLDISPIVAILILLLFQQAVAGTLLRGASFPVF